MRITKLLYFSKLLNRRIRLDKTNKKNGRLTDLVFRLAEPYPEAVGIYIEHGKGYPSELIPWEKVARIEEEAIFITPDRSRRRLIRSLSIRRAGFCSTNT